MKFQSFSPAIIERLGYYVYLLRDPETGEIFYVGKGTGNRIFAHINEAIAAVPNTPKLGRIRTIHAREQEVVYTIHRHGLTEKEAFEVEASLIDFLGLTELTNLVSGFDVLRGAKSLSEIIEMYDAPLLAITEPALIVIINRMYRRGMTADELYEIARGNWVVGVNRNRIKCVFAVSNGLVRQVYEVEKWHPIQETRSEYKTKTRWRFDGHVAEDLQHYVGGSVENYLKAGARNSIRYVNC